jgi:hypothetical protein
MLASALELFNFQVGNTSEEDAMQKTVQQLRARADTIHASSEKIITLENGMVVTELLNNLESKNNKAENLLFTMVCLQIQAKTITPPCFFPFFISCRRFFDQVGVDIASKFPIECMNFFVSFLDPFLKFFS